MTAPQPPAEPDKAPDAPKLGPPPVKPVDPPQGDGKPAEGQHGYPESTPVAEMDDRQAAAYWRHQSKKHEERSRTAKAELDTLKPKADQYDSLLDSTKSEQERAVETARKEAAGEVRAQAAVDLAGQRLHGLLMVRGKTEAEADDIVSDVRLDKYVKDGSPDHDELRKAAVRLAPNVEPAKAGPVDLGQGNRPSTAAKGVSAGRQMFADDQKSRPKPTT